VPDAAAAHHRRPTDAVVKEETYVQQYHVLVLDDLWVGYGISSLAHPVSIPDGIFFYIYTNVNTIDQCIVRTPLSGWVCISFHLDLHFTLCTTIRTHLPKL